LAFNLENTLVIGISATALFDLSEADALFKKEYATHPDNAIEIYRNYMLKHENTPLAEGIGFSFTKALLDLNRYKKDGDTPLVEVVVMSRNSPDTGVRVLNTIRKLNLDITRSAFTAGESSADYIEAFGVDLFLTTDEKDAQKVIDAGACASAVLAIPPEYKCDIDDGQVRIAFDGDAVLFDETSELVYKEEGIEAFHKNEDESQDIPMVEGPFASFLKNSILALLRAIVTFTVSSFRASSSGEGRKSEITFTFPICSSVYFIFRFIYFLSFPPISGAKNSDFIFSVSESYGHNSTGDSPKAIISLFLITVFQIL